MQRPNDTPLQRSPMEALRLIEQERALIKIMYSSIPFRYSDTPISIDDILSKFSAFLDVDIKLKLDKTLGSPASNTIPEQSNLYKKSNEKTSRDHWDSVVASLNTPSIHRRLKPANIDDQNVDRTMYVDPRSLTEEEIQNPHLIQWTKRSVNPVRGTPKSSDWEHTKKTSTSLLPTNGKMEYYQSVNAGEKDPVGLLFDINECNLKGGKYIWPESGVTDWRWWLRSNASHPRKKSITLAQLREHLREQVSRGQIPQHNEILACVSKKALKAIFAPKDILIHRLNALKIQLKLQQGLGISLPLLVIDPLATPRIYDINQQIADIKSVMRMDPDSREQLLLMEMMPDPMRFIGLHEELAKNIKTKVSQIAIELLEQGASPDYLFEGKSLLEHAVINEQYDVILKMLNLPQLPTPSSIEAAIKIAEEKSDSRLIEIFTNLNSTQSKQTSRHLDRGI